MTVDGGAGRADVEQSVSRPWLVAAGVATAALVVVLLVPGLEGPQPFRGFGLLEHVLAFGLLTVLWRCAVARSAGLVLALLSLATATEILQATLASGRDGSVADLLAAVVGVVVGAAVPYPPGR